MILQLNDRKFSVSKEILCRASPSFLKGLNSGFKEGLSQIVTLEEMKGVITERSLEALIQWIYTARIKFNTEDVKSPTRHISAILEFVRLADMRAMTGMESQMARAIEDILRCNLARLEFSASDISLNTHFIVIEHILSAELLPTAHPVRRVLAQASVDGYLRSRETFKFGPQLQTCPKFAADLLEEVGQALDKTRFIRGRFCFQDPMTKDWVIFNDRKGNKIEE